LRGADGSDWADPEDDLLRAGARQQLLRLLRLVQHGDRRYAAEITSWCGAAPSVHRYSLREGCPAARWRRSSLILLPSSPSAPMTGAHLASSKGHASVTIERPGLGLPTGRPGDGGPERELLSGPPPALTVRLPGKGGSRQRT